MCDDWDLGTLIFCMAWGLKELTIYEMDYNMLIFVLTVGNAGYTSACIWSDSENILKIQSRYMRRQWLASTQGYSFFMYQVLLMSKEFKR